MDCRAIFFIIFLLLVMPFAHADVPRLISVQGRLTDNVGTLITSPTDFTFWIYDAPAPGGNLLWTEPWIGAGAITPDSSGIFSVLLGSSNLLNIPFDIPYWLEVEINGETLTPRQQMGSAGYAINVADNSVTGAKIVDNSVTGADILDSSVSSSDVDFMGAIAANKWCVANAAGNALDCTADAPGGSDGDWIISGIDMYSGVTGNVGIGTVTPTNILSLGGDVARTIGVERSMAGAGSRLTLQAGGAQSGGTDLAGGELRLSSGVATGTGSSFITFYAAEQGGSGTLDRNPYEQVRITSGNYGRGRIGIATTSPREELQIGDRWTFQVIDAGPATAIGYNFYNWGGDRRIVGDESSSITFTSTGDISFRTAGSGLSGSLISWTQGLFQKNDGNVGIGTSNPQAKLDVAGSIKIADGTQGAGKVLTSIDASGLANWQAPASGSLGQSVMYLRKFTTLGAPAACPAGWSQADYTHTYHSDTRANYVRTCYRTDMACQVMYLRKFTTLGAPAACPAGWSQADYTHTYDADTRANYVRTCYLCN